MSRGFTFRIFDDAVADGWRPFALSRPVGELRFGARLQRERLESFAGERCREHLTRPWLESFREPDAPPAGERGSRPPDGDRLLLSSRFVPDVGARFERPEGTALLVVGGAAVGAWLPAGRTLPDPGWLERPGEARFVAGAAERALPGRVLEAPWEMVRNGPEQIARDLRGSASVGDRADRSSLPEGVCLLGDSTLRLGAGVRIEPGVLLDLRSGPIALAAGVEVLAGSRLAGPLFAGRGSRLLGGPVSALGAGPVSYLRGEISEVTTLGWTNKAHDGHLGHAYLGRWTNLGAGTTNSDLKNNYGPVRLGGPDGPVETGLTKLGCLLGDHVKTAIGTLLETGTVVGAGANVFGETRPPKWVPPFAWGTGEEWKRYRRDAFLDAAATVLGRRDVPFDERTRRWLAEVWREAARREAARREAGRRAERPAGAEAGEAPRTKPAGADAGSEPPEGPAGAQESPPSGGRAR